MKFSKSNPIYERRGSVMTFEGTTTSPRIQSTSRLVVPTRTPCWICPRILQTTGQTHVQVIGWCSLHLSSQAGTENKGHLCMPNAAFGSPGWLRLITCCFLHTELLWSWQRKENHQSSPLHRGQQAVRYCLDIIRGAACKQDHLARHQFTMLWLCP